MDTRWLVIAIIFFIVEVLTPGIFLFTCFSIGAFVSFVSSIFTKSILIQSAIFSVFSILSIYFLRPILTKLFMPHLNKTNVDRVIGKIGIVEEDIQGYRMMGIVKLENELWRAVAENNDNIQKGARVEVMKVEGTHLVVKKII
ncbi:MAG: NfeD family protein [Endomicrobia bacterium]|nr:NfeD family protein [Endomicrobiia bacterium]